MRLRIEHLPADVLGLSDLARAALAAGPALGPIPVVRRTGDVPRPPEHLDEARRAAVAEALRRGLAPLEPPARVATSLNVLAREGSAAVVTGQQPGFLCSPLLSLYKALQACRLAYELSQQWGRPVVPIFWNHADDHDVAEVHHTHIVNRNLDVQKVALAGFSSGRQPIARLPLDEDLHRLGALRELLSQAFQDRPWIEEALEVFFPRPGETLARALTRAFTALLGEHGLVVLEPDWVRAESTQALADIVGQDVAPELVRGADEMRAAGFEPGIDPVTAALVYRHDEGGRSALRPGGDGFRYDAEAGSRTPGELAAEMLQEPEAWSAGALLRPLVQDAILPTAAYVGGWGELAYHAELSPARRRAGLPVTPFVPRVSCTLVEPEVRVALERLDARLPDVLRAKGSYTPPNDDSEPPPVIADVRRSAAAAAQELLRHRAALGEVDRALAVNLKRTADQIEKLVEKLLAKAERVDENRRGKGRRHVRRLNHSLYPTGSPQERILGPLPTTARYGREWVDELYAEMPAVSSEHLAVHLGDDSEEVAT